MGEPVKIELVQYEGEPMPAAMLTAVAEGLDVEVEIELTEQELANLIDQGAAVLRGLRWSRTEYGATTGVATDHIFPKGASTTLCGISNDDGQLLTGHPYFGGPTACMCKRCERSYQRRQG